MTTELVTPGIYAERHTLYYWNTSTLAYEVATVPSGTGTGGGGDASAANQTTEITRLTSIDGKTPALGQALAASSVPVVLTAAQLSTLTPLSSVSVSNFPATQAVSGTVSTGLTQPLTDTQLRASAVPVSGTFWQTTQPVSGTVTANTGLTQPLTDTQLRASAVPVSGTFFQSTQPVSIAATVNTNTGLTQPLTDTQIRATALPVSLASVPSHAVTNAGTFAVQVTSAPSTAVTNAGTFVVQPELLNRVSCNAFSEVVAGIIAETAITMSKSLANAAVSTATTSGPTAGKNWRITSLLLSWVSTSTTANTARLRIRVNASGAATTSSPIQFSARIAWESPTFIANEGEFQQIPIPDGLDIPNGGQAMFTIACVAANGTLDVLALGYEYTP